MASKDFHAAALAALTNQIATQNSSTSFDPNKYAKSLIEDDLPKIDSAVKSHLSLVAARSSTLSEVDVLQVNSLTIQPDNDTPALKCVFVDNVNTSCLACARSLLAGINSTQILIETTNNAHHQPADDTENHSKEEKRLQQQVIRIVWNGLIDSSGRSQEEKKKLKPSKLMGREALHVVYPLVMERFRRGITAVKNCDANKNADESFESTVKQSAFDLELRSIPEEQLPPIAPPNTVDIGQWEAYYTEFGNLLNQACMNTNVDDVEDDSKLLWSMDGGVQELKDRRERRTKRAEIALADENTCAES